LSDGRRRRGHPAARRVCTLALTPGPGTHKQAAFAIRRRAVHRGGVKPTTQPAACNLYDLVRPREGGKSSRPRSSLRTKCHGPRAASSSAFHSVLLRYRAPRTVLAPYARARRFPRASCYSKAKREPPRLRLDFRPGRRPRAPIRAPPRSCRSGGPRSQVGHTRVARPSAERFHTPVQRSWPL